MAEANALKLWDTHKIGKEGVRIERAREVFASTVGTQGEHCALEMISGMADMACHEEEL